MWCILYLIGFISVLWGSYANEIPRMSMESLNITYANTNFGEISVKLIPVSKLTNKVRSATRFYFEPTDKLMITFTCYKIARNNKAHKMSYATKSLKSLMITISDLPLGQELRTYIEPDAYWPPQANVTYILHDWWFQHSRIPLGDSPMITGTFKITGIGKYPNNTILIKFEIVIRTFYSDKDFD